jgi:glyoxylase-like metal-dependent hydrolase (beta-lactamase superfamily II)
LIASIHEHLLTLPAETIVFPGHNQPTTIRDEHSLNPFLRDPDLAADAEAR